MKQKSGPDLKKWKEFMGKLREDLGSDYKVVDYSEDDILKLKKAVENALDLFHKAIWAAENSKEEEYFIKANNNLNDFYNKILKKYK